MLLAACSAATSTPPAATSAPSAPAESAAPSAGAPTTQPGESEPAATAAPSSPASEPPATEPAASEQPATGEPSLVPVAWRERSDIAPGPSARSDHTWTVASEGTTAYLFGGRTGDGASNELWQYDLATDSWIQVAPGPAPDPRWGHTATWVPEVGLVVWSGQNTSGFFGDIWRYEPSSNSWQELPSTGAVPEARYGSCASLGPDGRLWISHGFTQDDGRFADTRAYDLTTGEWVDETPSGRVPVERCLHDCFWTDDGAQLILYGGQTTGVPALGDVWAYDLATGDWTASADGAAPARQLYALASSASGGLIFGGGALEGGYLDDSWQLDPQTLTLTALDVPAGPAGRAGATLIDDGERGRLLLFGGQGAEGAFADVWEIGRP